MRNDIYNIMHDGGRARKHMKIVRPRIELNEDGECLLPSREAMGEPHHWTLRTTPLLRIIARNVGRPWNDVYSELCASLRQRDKYLTSVMKFTPVETNTVQQDGKVLSQGSWGGRFTSVDSVAGWRGATYYVDPVSGLLCRSAVMPNRNKRLREEAAAAIKARRRDIGYLKQAHLIEGIWYEVRLGKLASQAKFTATLQPLQAAVEKAWVAYYIATNSAAWIAYCNAKKALDEAKCKLMPIDILSGYESDPASKLLFQQYGRYGVYGVSKRQLNSAELKKYGLLKLAD